MIAALRGVVLEKNLNDAVLDVNGIGYRVFFSLLTLSRLPDEGQAVHVRVRTVVRDDALDLYGFLSQIEEQMFLLLTSVSHVGPKLALTVMSALENLGYKPAQAEHAADLATAAAGADAPFELLFREALKRLRAVPA